MFVKSACALVNMRRAVERTVAPDGEAINVQEEQQAWSRAYHSDEDDLGESSWQLYCDFHAIKPLETTRLEMSRRQERQRHAPSSRIDSY